MELVRKSPTERMTFADGNWVELRCRLTIEERKRLMGAALSFAPGTNAAGKATLVPAADLAAVEMTALEIGIVGWSLPDDLTRENIALLDEETGDAIKARLDVLWRTRTDDERKNSSGGGAGQSAAAASPQSSAG